jgi:proteasome lid subunit RPN8/RPN11
MRWKDEPVRLALRPLAAFAGAIDAPVAGSVPAIVVASEARDTARRHVAGHRVERGGLLIGEPFAQDDDPHTIALVHVRAAIPATDDTGDAISLRMEARVWDEARAAMRAGERVVGWFHSHPDIGAFFSGTDRRTQAAFFAQAFSLGWVIDPVRGEDAWFLGADARDVVQSRVFTLEGLP